MSQIREHFESTAFSEQLKNFPFKGLIFDGDETLYATDEIWQHVMTAICAKRGVVLTEEIYRETAGRGLQSQIFPEMYGWQVSPENLFAEMVEEYIKYFKDGNILQAMPGVPEFIGNLKEFDIDLAIASTSGTNLIKMNLERLNIEDRFKVIVGGDQIKKGKPDPEIFLKAAELLDIPPSACLVFEDSPSGVSAAQRAGMMCVLIPNRRCKRNDFATPDLMFDSFHDVNLELLAQLGTQGKIL